MKVRYVGQYKGFSPLANKELSPGDIIEVSDKVAEQLLTTQQFEKVKEPKEEATTKEVKERGKMARHS